MVGRVRKVTGKTVRGFSVIGRMDGAGDNFGFNATKNYNPLSVIKAS